MADLFIGLMSGTSRDGVDAALVRVDDAALHIEAKLEFPYPEEVSTSLDEAIRAPGNLAVDDFGRLDQLVGACFRDAVLALLSQAGIEPDAVTAIGSHGQTLRHRPDADLPFTLQIGDPAVIAKGTGITTVADFRRADIAVGGQGAPLVPIFHDWLFRDAQRDRVVVNIGGIANVTVLPARDSTVIGFDTGPGNTLLDAWIRQSRGHAYDRNGDWAATGIVDNSLLSRCMKDPYFAAPPPKSTGFEYFNLDWLTALGAAELEAVDVQATLCALTAESIAAAILRFADRTREVFVCGGGVHNGELMRRLASRLSGMQLASTGDVGLDPDWVEACAFAWLARRTLNGLPGNLPSVTGARRATILGAVFPA